MRTISTFAAAFFMMSALVMPTSAQHMHGQQQADDPAAGGTHSGMGHMMDNPIHGAFMHLLMLEQHSEHLGLDPDQAAQIEAASEAVAAEAGALPAMSALGESPSEDELLAWLSDRDRAVARAYAAAASLTDVLTDEQTASFGEMHDSMERGSMMQAPTHASVMKLMQAVGCAGMGMMNHDGMMEHEGMMKKDAPMDHKGMMNHQGMRHGQ